MATINVFSELPYPMSGRVKVAEATEGREAQYAEYLITPGDNHLDEDIWAKLEKDERIDVRIQRRRLRPKNKTTIYDLEVLRGSVDRRYIRELCATADVIPDDEMFDGSATSIDGRMRQMEDEMRRLRMSK